MARRAHSAAGSRNDLVYGDGYEGDLLLEIDPRRRTVQNLGPVAGRLGVPSRAATADGRTLVGEAVDPATDAGALLIFDVAAREVVDTVVDRRHVGFRALAVAGDDRVIYSVGDGGLGAYDPASGTTSDSRLGSPMSGYVRQPPLPTGRSTA